jgi:REP-associated tyrosine transposase
MGREVQVSSSGVNGLGYHVVWCPKYRRPILAGPVKDRCEALLQEKAARHEWRITALEVMPDHLHLFVKAHPRYSSSYIANQFKGSTSHARRAEFPRLRSRLPTLWSRSYFAAIVDASAATAQRYIETQYKRPWRKGKTR